MAESRYSFPTGAARLVRDWETGGTYDAMLLLASWTPNPTADVFVDDISAYELTDASYSRQTVANPTRTIDVANLRVDFGCDDIDFGIIAGGEVATWFVLFASLGSDAMSQLAVAYAISYTANGVDTAVFTASPVAFRLNMTCPEDFS